VLAAEVRLLYENATTGIWASVLIALPLAYIQRNVSTPLIISAWLAFMLAVAVTRFAIARGYWRDSLRESSSRRWKALFVAGTAAAAAAWGVAGMLFYDPAQPTSGTFLMFVLGGVMLGGAPILAARPEAFLTFFLPIGLLTSARLAITGGEEHLLMAFLVVVFTAATIATTWRFHIAIASSLELRFDNLELVQGLSAAKNYTDALNRDLELRVQDRTALLTEADQRKNEFLATLAHELRNPLAPIRFALETLKGDRLPSAAARARDVIDRQVGQLVRLVDDLLDVSRITTGKMMLRREPHDLARLMTTAVESIMPLVTAANHTLEVQLPVVPSYVDGDGARVVQVFANALNNAVKFTPRGGRIWFTAERRSNEAVVRIRDNGLGIAPDVLPRVFDMFQQAEPILERSAGGLGIGLTLARRLVEMHQGRIEIRSPGPGQGTEVEIRLPTTAAVDADAMKAEKPTVGAARSLRVLIVEDNLDAAEMLDTAVSVLGHNTRIANDGVTALTLAGQFAPEVVLLDVGLPVMNGYAVAQALRARPEHHRVHIAAVTGWGQDEDRRKAREAGFDSHFTKPLAPAALEELLTRVAHDLAADGDGVSGPRTRFTDAASTKLSGDGVTRLSGRH
jgi:signal transduction histidine kinase/ActR/RegA family two-component response regulator